MEAGMNSPEKQLKYSIRKVSVGAASVVIGALYLLMGAGIAHAEGVESAREAERTANSTNPEWSGNGETGNKPDLNNTDAAANTYNAPVAENPLVAPEAAKPRRTKRATPDGDTGETPAGNTGTESEPISRNEGGSDTADTDSALLDANRKGDVVKDDQPGVRVPKAGEKGADDKNANLTFDDPGEDATVEEMWKIIQNMPDDFQNNERSYLRNMDTLGDALRFKNGKVSEDADGVKLQDGEIREIDSFGGWRAINKEGHAGKFAIGKKNAQGYFTGWYIDKDGKRQQGGMLGSNALDQIYVHEQALDRRFKYMLMLAKGRTIANKDDKAQDNSPFDIETANRKGNKENLAKLPVKDKEDILQHSPNIEGFNGIEKTFTAFSTKYGSRLKIDFVTGYISDYEGAKGTYRIVVKAIKKGATADAPNVEETIYDHTINRIDGIVENEERYSQGVDLSGVNRVIKKIFQDEYNKKVTTLANAEYTKKYPGVGKKDTAKLNALKEEVKQELAKKGDVIYELPIDKEKLREVRSKFKEEINIQAGYATVANKLKNILSPKLDAEVQKDSPVWENSSETYPDNPTLTKSKDPDRVYKILDFVLPTAKKIIYHADTDQLELQTDPDKVKKHRAELETKLNDKKAKLETADETNKTKLNKEISALKAAIGSTNAYTYLEARNGSQEAKILGSHMEAKTKPPTNEMTDADYKKYHTNELAAQHNTRDDDGLKAFTAYFVEKGNVERSKVISDEELSKKIHAEIGGDKDKLGKGGYFSTGDIPLGKDVVAYKIQVFAENEKRVGVNKQSPRLQYNLPILADFSVIQDTVEPSKEVTTRIITKLKEQGKITEDQEKKIKEEIKKSKKTSELRSQLSGDVKVKYQDVNGTLLTLKNTVTGQKETDLGKKGEDGTYLAVDSGLRYTNYDVTDKKLDTITTSDGKRYRLKRSLADNSLEDGRLKASDAETGTISDSPATVTFVYEEDTTPPAPAEVDVTRTVKRTITYVKEDNVNGTIKRTVLEKQTKENTVTFTGKEVTDTEHNTVSYKDWTSTNSKFPKVDTPVLEGYIADIASVGEEEATAPTSTGEVTNLTKEVVYTKLGNWVPNLPKGVTPPEGTDITPKPYPNNPTDPTKPGEPTDPNVPVIPYVPGYTPKIGDKPLEPVDPKHPENGYKVPPVPTEPGKDTPIEYVKDGQQKAITSFVDPKGNVLETPITETGDSNTPLTKDGEIKATIAKLKLKGYDVETNTYPPKGTFDNDPKVDQYFKVTLTPRVKPVKPFDPTDPKDPNKPVPGQPIDPDTPVDPNNPNDPTIPRWTEDLINKLETTKQVTRTINYVDEEGNKLSEPSTDKVTFTREAKINVVTGEIAYGDWKAVGGDSTFDKVSSPVVKGYILKDPAQKEVAERKGITPTVANQTIEVVYKKLGSWVPKVPGVETPTPLPYPNDPTDPTKPGEPEYPQPGTPVEPNTPVIPYVPGYTPKTPDGNPLVPVDPEHPENGYKVPPVPTEPGKDTPIEYVKVPNTPSPEEPVKPTPESNHITIWVDENGKPLKPEKPGTHEPGNIPGYRYITTVTKDGVTIHRFEKITPVEPNNPVPQKPTTPIPTPQDPTIPTPESQIPIPNTPEANTPTSETSRRVELPNTGTEANATLASVGIMTLLAGLGLGFFKKKEDEK